MSIQIIFSNIPNEKEWTTIGRCKRYLYKFDNPDWGKSTVVSVGSYDIKIGKYRIPEWSPTYWKWFRNHADWFKSWHDTYTVTFIVHAIFFYLLLWVFAWRYYSKHLAQDIKPLLEKLNYDEQKDEYEKCLSSISNILDKPKNEIKYMSHPCGSYNKDTFEILKELGIELGFKQIMTIEPEKGMKKINNSFLEIARQDHAEIYKRMN